MKISLKGIDLKKLLTGLAPIVLTVVPVVKQAIQDAKKTPKVQ